MLAVRDNWEVVRGNILADLSYETQRSYAFALDQFRAFMGDRNMLDRAAVADFKKHLAESGAAPATINARLAAIRRMVDELAALGIIPIHEAMYIQRVKGAKRRGVRQGLWLSTKKVNALLAKPDLGTVKGRRDLAILAVLVNCGLRRSEIASLKIKDLQRREDYWLFADLIGKHQRIRSVKIPENVKGAINVWLELRPDSSPEDPLFVAVAKGGKIAHRAIGPQAIYEIVQLYGRMIEVPELRPHDLRRTFARRALKAGAELRHVQLDLGHSSAATTETYVANGEDLSERGTDYLNFRIPRPRNGPRNGSAT